MFIPVGSDTPIYRWPVATVLLIGMNIFCYFVQHKIIGEGYALAPTPANAPVLAGFQFDDLDLGQQDGDQNEEADEAPEGDWKEFDGDDELPDLEFEDVRRQLANGAFDRVKKEGWRQWTLWTGNGLHLTQWLTMFFMHGDAGHLIGNMIFLALFGFLIENRMGNWQFMVYYLCLGLLGSALTQILLLYGQKTFCLGASGAIAGLMVTAAMWMPKTNITCMFIIFFRPFFVPIPVLLFAAFYMLYDLGGALLVNFQISTPLLHILGATAGTITSLFVLRKRWVDTEHRDIISLIIEASGRDPKKVNPKVLSAGEKRAIEEEKQLEFKSRQQRLANVWRSIDAHLAANNLDAAIEMEIAARRLDANSTWTEDRLLKLIGKLQANQDWKNVTRFSELYLQRFSGKEDSIRINLAKILVIKHHQPRKAIKTLHGLRNRSLSLKQQKLVQQIVLEARKQIASGTLEFEDD